MDIAKALEKIGEAFKSLFDFAETAKNRQSETVIGQSCSTTEIKNR